MIEVQQVLINLSARRTENDTHERLAKKFVRPPFEQQINLLQKNNQWLWWG